MAVWSELCAQSTFSTAVEKKLQTYIMAHVQQVPYMSIRQLSVASGTSDSAVTRFCHRLGLAGYKELRVELSKVIPAIEKTHINVNAEISRFDSIEEIFRKTTRASIQVLEQTEQVLEIEKLEEAVSIIHQARNVHLVAAGNSQVVALDASYKFQRINIQSFFAMDYHMQLLNCTYMNEQDVMLAVTTSGKTREIVKLLQLAKEKQAKTICVAQVGRLPSDAFSDIKLNVPYSESEVREGTLSARIAQLNIIDTLFLGVLCQRFDEVRDGISDSRKVAQHTKLTR